MIAYWFSKLDGTTMYMGIPARIGRTDTVDGTLVPCRRGLHASPTPWNAFNFHAGPMLWEVQLGGTIIEHGNPVDKYAANKRTYLRKADMTTVLYKIGAEYALSVIDKWRPDPIVMETLQEAATGVYFGNINIALALIYECKIPVSHHKPGGSDAYYAYWSARYALGGGSLSAIEYACEAKSNAYDSCTRKYTTGFRSLIMADAGVRFNKLVLDELDRANK